MLRYYLHILSGLRPEKIRFCLDRCHEICGKSKLLMFFDMLICILRYGAGFFDYMMYGFFDRTAAERNTYVTRVRNKKLIRYMNDPDYISLVDDKLSFNKRYGSYLHRAFLDGDTATEDEFAGFMADKEVCFAKPVDGSSGQGVERLRKSDFADSAAMLAHIRSKGSCVIEEALRQHEEMNALYPNAVNCMRIVTDIGDDGKPYITYAVLKSGSGGDFCDNTGRGGVVCALDKKSGRVISPATDDMIVHVYEKHPDSGVQFVGFQVPMYDEAAAMCLEAAMVTPQVRHIGWDVAITPEGPAFIEGNTFPGTDLCQLYWNTPGRQGFMPFLREILPAWKY